MKKNPLYSHQFCNSFFTLLQSHRYGLGLVTARIKRAIFTTTVAFFFIALMSVSSVLIAQEQNISMPVIRSTSFKKDTFNIVRYGAGADGVTLNTKAIQDAIDACTKNNGGMVVIPAGFWLTGPIVVKNNVNLHLKKSALLQFTRDVTQYPLVKGNWEGVSRNIIMDKMNYDPASGTVLNISGDKSQQIVLSKSDVKDSKKQVTFPYGATDKALQIK